MAQNKHKIIPPNPEDLKALIRDACQEIHELAYAAGREDGHEKGYAKGYQDGYSIGHGDAVGAD